MGNWVEKCRSGVLGCSLVTGGHRFQWRSGCLLSGSPKKNCFLKPCPFSPPFPQTFLFNPREPFGFNHRTICFSPQRLFFHPSPLFSNPPPPQGGKAWECTYESWQVRQIASLEASCNNPVEAYEVRRDDNYLWGHKEKKQSELGVDIARLCECLCASGLEGLSAHVANLSTTKLFLGQALRPLQLFSSSQNLCLSPPPPPRPPPPGTSPKCFLNCQTCMGLAGERVNEVFSEMSALRFSSCLNPIQMFHTSSASRLYRKNCLPIICRDVTKRWNFECNRKWCNNNVILTTLRIVEWQVSGLLDNAGQMNRSEPCLVTFILCPTGEVIEQFCLPGSTW